MLFGHTNRLGFEIHPLSPSWERRYPPETTAWARFSLWVSGVNLCRHVVEGADAVRNSVNVPLAPLANWLVEAWPYIAFEERPRVFATSEDLFASLDHWGDSLPAPGLNEDAWFELRDAWWSHHFLAAGAEGAVLPVAAFARHHSRFVAQWRPRLSGAPDRRVLYAGGQASFSWDDTAEAVRAFVRYIGAWLHREGQRDVYAWVSSKDPLAASRPDLLTALELFTARGRDELASLTGAAGVDAIVRGLGLAPHSDDPASSPVTQALRDLPSRLPDSARLLLQELDTTTRLTPPTRRIEELRNLAIDAARGSDSPEIEGYQAAAALRRSLGLNGTPIANTRELVEELGGVAEFRDVRIPGTRMISGFRRSGTGTVILLRSDRTEVEWGGRFETMRALGHMLLDSWRGDALGAASSPFGQGFSRRRSGAFAAEFLLPESAVKEKTGGALDAAAEPKTFQSLLAEFGVGAKAAAYHLWNRGYLSNEEIREQLVEDFGHV